MAEATITGSVQAGTNSSSVVNKGGAAVNTLTFGDSNGNTVINIGDSEDLGDGLKFFGNIALEVGDGGSTSSTFQSNGVNETYAGLSGGFGTVKAGALQTPQFLAIANGDAGAGYLIGNIVSKLNQHQGGSTGTTNLIQASSVQYTLPTFVDGLSLKYQTRLSGDADNLYGANFYAADYKSGALTAGLVYSTYKYSATQTDTTSTYYATYNFGPATLKTLWTTAHTDGSTDVNGASIGIAVPMGASTFMYNHSSSNGMITNGTSNATTRTVSTINQAGDFVGVMYSFSKRTTGFVAYYKETGNDNTGAAANVVSNSNWATTRFILIHSF